MKNMISSQKVIMKVILATMLTIPMLSKAQTQPQSYNIKGTVANAIPNAKVYIRRNGVIDSARVENGQFNYAGTTAAFPVHMVMFLTHNANSSPRTVKDYLQLYADAGETRIDVKDSLKRATVTGKTNEEMKDYVKYVRVEGGDAYGVNGMEVLTITFRAAPGITKTVTDTSAKARASMARLDRRNQLLKERRVLQKKYIETHPNSYASTSALLEFAGGLSTMDTTTVSALLKSLSAGIQNSPNGKSISAELQYIRDGKVKTYEQQHQEQVNKRKPAFEIGAMAADFTVNDKNDKPVKLSDFRGKYVLIDFWASWCGPCRAENPNVLSAYNEYKDRNFTVLGMALEKPGDKDKWLAAIKKDGLPWTEVSDFSFWSSPVAKLYNVNSIPRNYLVDPSGRIVATDLRGAALQKKLAEVLLN